MRALFKPYLIGTAMGIIAILGLWLSIPMLFSIFGDAWTSWYPILVVIAPLILGGFVSARQMRSQYLTRYFFMGGFVGISIMLFLQLVMKSEGSIWPNIFLVLAGGAISVFGAYLGVLKNRKA
ncbi:MAG: hypothetical protein AB2809_22970 [Candidatus Thiodiazotropha sp.]